MYPEKFMASAMELAKIAYKENEVPVGAIVVKSGMVIGRGFNQVITTNSVSSHAEIIAINNASQTINNYRLKECDIYVTLEPCHMCAKAIVDARIQNLYFATPEPKTGSIISVDNFLDKNCKANLNSLSISCLSATFSFPAVLYGILVEQI